jgi:hypothetical protein
LLPFSWGFAPGWYKTAPSALVILLFQLGLSAEGAIHISLGRSPRKQLRQTAKG